MHLGHLLETGTTEEIFKNPILGIDYNNGTDHLISGSHYVKCTDEEFDKWSR